MAWRTRWSRPSGWVRVPSFSGPASAGKTTVACSVSAGVTKSANAITPAAASSACSQRPRSGWVTSGSACSSTSVVRSPSTRPSAICAADRPAAGASARPGPRLGSTPASRRPRALADSGTSIRPDSGLSAMPSGGGHRQQRVHRRGAAVAVGHALAPEDHHVAGVLQRLGRGGDRARLGAGARAQARAVGAVRAQLGGQRGQRGVGGAGRVAHAGAVGVQRAGAAGQRHQLGVRCGARPCARAGPARPSRRPARTPPPAPRRRGRCR